MFARFLRDPALIEALASQAAVSLENQNCLNKKNLLDSFIELMASAVDAVTLHGWSLSARTGADGNADGSGVQIKAAAFADFD